MSAELLPLGFVVPVVPRVTLAQLRDEVTRCQALAVAELRMADDVSGKDNGADDLAESFLEADRVQGELLRYLREWQERDKGETVNSEDLTVEWKHPEGPLGADERAMMKAFQLANDRLNDLRMAIAALRAREVMELSEAGAVVTLCRMA